MAEWIKEYKDMFPPEFCEVLCKLVDKCVEEKKHASFINTETRKCTQLYFPSTEISESREIYDTFKAYVTLAYNKYKSDMKDPTGGLSKGFRMEQPCILKYEPRLVCSEGNFFNEHSDNWNSESAARQISFIVYLNDVDKGGETIFTTHEKIVLPKKGTILFFPSFFLYPHRACEPISGNKYVAVGWMCMDGSGPFYLRL